MSCGGISVGLSKEMKTHCIKRPHETGLEGVRGRRDARRGHEKWTNTNSNHILSHPRQKFIKFPQWRFPVTIDNSSSIAISIFLTLSHGSVLLKLFDAGSFFSILNFKFFLVFYSSRVWEDLTLAADPVIFFSLIPPNLTQCQTRLEAILLCLGHFDIQFSPLSMKSRAIFRNKFSARVSRCVFTCARLLFLSILLKCVVRKTSRTLKRPCRSRFLTSIIFFLHESSRHRKSLERWWRKAKASDSPAVPFDERLSGNRSRTCHLRSHSPDSSALQARCSEGRLGGHLEVNQNQTIRFSYS